MKEKKFYGMMNNYMFKAVLQEDKEVLTNLVAALLGIEEVNITTCEIVNPIELGKSVEAKDCILDIKLILNENETINIEMQLENEGNWPERSLLYWSRAYDSIKAGDDYSMLKPTYHIGILNFTLFREYPEFYSEYKLINKKTGKVYTDKLSIRILDLTNIDIACEDEAELARWARIFKARTMEELTRLAGTEEVMQNMVVTIAKLSEEEKIRQQCEAREKNEMDMRSYYKYAMKQGLKEGREEGLKEGREEGLEEAIISLVRDGIITFEIAADKLGKTVTEIEGLL